MKDVSDIAKRKGILLYSVTDPESVSLGWGGVGKTRPVFKKR